MYLMFVYIFGCKIWEHIFLMAERGGIGGGGRGEYTMYNTVGEKRQDKRRRSKTYKEKK
jgi:hypothetical protein